MRQHNYKLLPLLALLLAVTSPSLGRRIRVRPQAVPVEESAVEDQEPRSQRLQYYAAAEAPEADDGQQYVVVPSDDAYSGVYGRQSISRQSDAVEAYRPRQIVPGSKQPTARLRDTPKQPPVQTLRNYNKVNDDGSFTFGYEAADGSFKEETRGTDCVVRGKYGYVDPDGNKREFTYVSGNPCDPNAPNEEQEEKDAPTDSGEENVPKGPAGRPLRPRPALAPARPTTTVFQNNYVQDEEAEEPQQILYTPSPRTLVTARPTTVYQPQPESPRSVVTRPTPQSAIRITPRPHSATTVRAQLPATTYRPRLQASPTPRPGVVYSNTIQPSPTPHHASPASVDFEETLRQFQLENNVLTSPRPLAQRPQARPQLEPLAAGKGNALYETQLVYDPASGQYNTVFYQNVPQTSNNINLRQRVQPYVQQQQQHHQQPAYQPRPQIPQQQVYQQQQATVLQQSQQLFAQQQQRQRALAQQVPQVQEQQQPRFTQFQSPAQRYPLQQQYYQQQLAKEPTRQQFYYVSPSSAPSRASDNVSHGQIDAFLRGHNIAF